MNDYCLFEIIKSGIFFSVSYLINYRNFFMQNESKIFDDISEKFCLVVDYFKTENYNVKDNECFFLNKLEFLLLN